MKTAKLLTNQDYMVVENTWSRVKIKSKLTNFKIKSRIEGIMVNKGQIYRKLGKFVKISLNLIKSDDEMVIEIRLFDILRKRTQR